MVCFYPLLKALDRFGNCQRPVFLLGVSQHLPKITNLWKFDSIGHPTTPWPYPTTHSVDPNCVESMSLFHIYHRAPISISHLVTCLSSLRATYHTSMNQNTSAPHRINSPKWTSLKAANVTLRRARRKIAQKLAFARRVTIRCPASAVRFAKERVKIISSDMTSRECCG